MKRNVTLSMDESLLDQSRKYAQENGTTLNQLVRDLLKRTVCVDSGDPRAEFKRIAKSLNLKRQEGVTWTREELHERKDIY